MGTFATLNQKWALDLLMGCLKINGVTGKEAAIAKHVVASLVNVGISKNQIKYDTAHKEIPLPTECGNVIVTLPGNVKGPRLLFSTHLDTVPLCAGAVPILKGKKSTLVLMHLNPPKMKEEKIDAILHMKLVLNRSSYIRGNNEDSNTIYGHVTSILSACLSSVNGIAFNK